MTCIQALCSGYIDEVMFHMRVYWGEAQMLLGKLAASTSGGAQCT